MEKLPEVAETLVIGQHLPRRNAANERIVLFVKLAEGASLDEALAAKPERRGRKAAEEIAAASAEDGEQQTQVTLRVCRRGRGKNLGEGTDYLRAALQQRQNGVLMVSVRGRLRP